MQDRTIKQIKEKYKFDEIKDAFDEGNPPSPQFEFSFGDDNDNFLLTCNFLSLSEDNNEFVFFLCSDRGQNILTNNSLSIHIETGDIFYNDFNTKENFYKFLLVQQDELKQFIKINHYSFAKYTRSYLPSFSLEEIHKLHCYQIKTQNTCCTSLMTGSNPWLWKKL